MIRVRVLRVAELIQADAADVRATVDDLPKAVSATVAPVAGGVLVTLEHRRRWWDLRPRRAILSVLLRRLDRVTRATSRVSIVGAAIERDGLILAAQRELPVELAGKWEFPGGKVELGESLETALARECREELGVEVLVGSELGRAQLPTGATLVVLHAVLADSSQQPQALEHRELRWCAPSELAALDWLDYDVGFAASLVASQNAG